MRVILWFPLCADDFESKFTFHSMEDFPPPDEYKPCQKIYPSKIPRSKYHLAKTPGFPWPSRIRCLGALTGHRLYKGTLSIYLGLGGWCGTKKKEEERSWLVISQGKWTCLWGCKVEVTWTRLSREYSGRVRSRVATSFAGHQSLILSQGLANIFFKGPERTCLRFCWPSGLYHNNSALLFWHESSHRKHIKKWALLSASKTLFGKAGTGCIWSAGCILLISALNHYKRRVLVSAV